MAIQRRQPVPPRTPAERVRAAMLARDMVMGRVPLPPLRCGHCMGSSIQLDPEPSTEAMVRCLSCGRKTRLKIAHKMRQQEIAAILTRPSPA